MAAGPRAGVVLPGYLTLLALWLGLGARLRARPDAGSLLVQSAAPETASAPMPRYLRSHVGLLLPYPLAEWLGAARPYR